MDLALNNPQRIKNKEPPTLFIFGLLSSYLLWYFKTNVSAVVSSSFLQVSFLYLSIRMIQPGKSFLKFDSWSNRVFKNLGKSNSNIVVNSQTSKMVSLIEQFLYLDD